MEPPGSEASDARSKDKGIVPVIDVDSKNVNQRVDEHIDERVKHILSLMDVEHKCEVPVVENSELAS
ncbi:hypothetical protein Tco_1155763 [Tanacetum coccineum]